MGTLQDALQDLLESLDEEVKMFVHNQQIHFDWLRSVEFELEVYSDYSPPLPASLSVPVLETLKNDDSLDISPLVPISELPNSDATPQINHSSTAPSLEFRPNLKFVDDSSLLLDAMISSDDDGLEPVSPRGMPFTASVTYSELSQTASSFHAHWQSMLEMKKAQTNTPAPQAIIANDESEPSAYEMTDDEEAKGEGSDDEIYERNPFKIHGKVIPTWARQDQLLEHLRQQKTTNADEIFTEMPKTCLLSKIFEKVKHSTTENDPKLTNQKPIRSRKATPSHQHVKTCEPVIYNK